jgi:hypothetical protein
MSNQNAKGKSKYESPILVPLGGLAKGSGVCVTGSSVVPVACSAGGADAGSRCTCGAAPVSDFIDCSAGEYASRDCVAGPRATRDCTAGECAKDTTCSAGGHVAEAYP